MQGHLGSRKNAVRWHLAEVLPFSAEDCLDGIAELAAPWSSGVAVASQCWARRVKWRSPWTHPSSTKTATSPVWKSDCRLHGAWAWLQGWSCWPFRAVWAGFWIAILVGDLAAPYGLRVSWAPVCLAGCWLLLALGLALGLPGYLLVAFSAGGEGLGHPPPHVWWSSALNTKGGGSAACAGMAALASGVHGLCWCWLGHQNWLR